MDSQFETAITWTEFDEVETVGFTHSELKSFWAYCCNLNNFGTFFKKTNEAAQRSDKDELIHNLTVMKSAAMFNNISGASGISYQLSRGPTKNVDLIISEKNGNTIFVEVKTKQKENSREIKIKKLQSDLLFKYAHNYEVDFKLTDEGAKYPNLGELFSLIDAGMEQKLNSGVFQSSNQYYACTLSKKPERISSSAATRPFYPYLSGWKEDGTSILDYASRQINTERGRCSGLSYGIIVLSYAHLQFDRTRDADLIRYWKTHNPRIEVIILRHPGHQPNRKSFCDDFFKV